MKKILSVFIFVLFAASLHAQVKKAPLKKQAKAQVKSVDTIAANKIAKKKLKVPPRDGFYARKDIDSTEMVPLADVRDEDVFYAKRIWREIDLRDTVNSILKAPKSRLIDVILNAVKSGELTAYAPIDSSLNEDDAFNNPMQADSAKSVALGTVEVSDNKSGTVTTVVNDFNPESFLKYRIKEDWIFDSKRSVFEPRIVGIAPLKLNATTNQWQPVFWIYYPEAREVLSKKRLVNTRNDASTLSFDDFFIRRLFSSYIVKESNPGDNKLKDIIADPRERLYESNRIQNSLLDYEQGLWEY
ncbi:gliding motility associated protein GldN [Pedobacter sp. UYP30]|uniref:type IX secretion system ring protein PorN/GldN n=1 Tax=Pedobacter sp. UYP30 TaxID=1756400 RepID=UPI00339402D6